MLWAEKPGIFPNFQIKSKVIVETRFLRLSLGLETLIRTTPMESITLNKLSPQLSQSRPQRAINNGRTMEEEITAILAKELTNQAPSTPETDLATAIEQRFASFGEFDLPTIPRAPTHNKRRWIQIIYLNTFARAEKPGFFPKFSD